MVFHVGVEEVDVFLRWILRSSGKWRQISGIPTNADWRPEELGESRGSIRRSCCIGLAGEREPVSEFPSGYSAISTRATRNAPFGGERLRRHPADRHWGYLMRLALRLTLLAHIQTFRDVFGTEPITFYQWPETDAESR